MGYLSSLVARAFQPNPALRARPMPLFAPPSGEPGWSDHDVNAEDPISVPAGYNHSLQVRHMGTRSDDIATELLQVPQHSSGDEFVRHDSPPSEIGAMRQDNTTLNKDGTHAVKSLTSYEPTPTRSPISTKADISLCRADSPDLETELDALPRPVVATSREDVPDHRKTTRPVARSFPASSPVSETPSVTNGRVDQPATLFQEQEPLAVVRNDIKLYYSAERPQPPLSGASGDVVGVPIPRRFPITAPKAEGVPNFSRDMYAFSDRAPLRSQPEPVLHVSIGRLEVRATSPPAAKGSRQPPAGGSLEEYLRKRSGQGTL